VGPVGAEAAPAKLNLALHVVGRRADGYHELQSLVAFADVADDLEATEAPADRLRITGPFAPALPNGETNLVMKAVAAFRARWPGRVNIGLALELRKNLPIAAGLGGGSADAAAALRLMAGLSSEAIPGAELGALALTLGADVPMCLVSRPAEVRGIGEIVRPVKSFPACHAVLINPLSPVVTADVFRRLREHAYPAAPSVPQPLTRPELALWLSETRNDLEPPAIEILPAIRGLIDAMKATQGCWLSRMSGSGATVFGLFGSGAQAHQAAHDLRARFPGYWVAAAPLIGP
jgi:4-diphosphocytidyl-2-C-methyl-D-erythritol kinase